jgi:hypothetical protein
MGASSASAAKRSLAVSTTTITTAPKMVLPVPKSAPLKHSLQKKARTAYPSSHYQKAMYFKQKGDKSRALVEFLKATQENPRLTKAFYEQALIFRERGYLKLAQSSLEQALALKPDYHEGRMLLATIQIQQGNFGGAMQQLGQSLGIAVATKDSSDSEAEELPQPTVLQSLHTLLPENVATGIANLTVGKTSSTSRTNNKTATKSEQRSAFHRAKKSAQPKVEQATETTEEKTRPDTVQILESKGSESLTDSILSHLPALPPLRTEEPKPESNDKVKPEKPHKRAKKSWFSRFMTALETPPAEQNEAPHAPPPIVPDDEPKPGDAAVKSIPALKPEQVGLVPAQVETFEKPDQPRQIIEKVTAMASAAISNASKSNFQFPNLPNLPNLNSSIFNTHSGNGTEGKGEIASQPLNTTVDEPKPYKPTIAPNSDDPWSVRLRYLADHGTGTLKEGEAFMFSEESGEATLFLADGQTVRRTIYLPRDAQEVVKQRRPDILTPDDLLYNLSLLAKLMPKANEVEQPASTAKTQQQTQTAQPPFEANDLMGKSQRFWGWMKDTLKL